MQTFKDKKGTEWVIELTLYTAQVLEESDFSAMYDGPIVFLKKEDVEGRFFTEGMTNTALVGAMVYAACKKQADELGIGQDEFCSRLDQPAIERMKAAFWEEVADFFPEYRTFLLKLTETFKNATRRIGDKLSSMKIEDNMDSLLDTMLKSLDRDLSRTLTPMTGVGEKSGISPATLEPTGDQ